MTAYRLFIPGMVCGSAVDSIERTLRNLAGVREVEPETHQHVIRVEVDQDSRADDLIRAVEQVGFQVSSCSTGASLQSVR